MPNVNPFACASCTDITNPSLGLVVAPPSTFTLMVTFRFIPPTATIPSTVFSPASKSVSAIVG